MDKKLNDICTAVLKEELLPALGCTEPISVAYAAAIAKKTLGEEVARAEVAVSGNILKNVKGVVVPNTGGLKGIIAAVAAGVTAGDPSRGLEVISGLTDKDFPAIREFISRTPVSLSQSHNGCVFDIRVTLYGNAGVASVRIAGHHTNVAEVTKNGKTLVSGSVGEAEADSNLTDRSALSVRGIVEYAENVDLSEVEEALTRQIEYNTAIAEEGLKGDYGARVGKVLLAAFGGDVHNRARAYAAAGSDARMNGCGLPVVIVSGSGNQGITASLPVIVYAKELGCPREKLLRALIISDLTTIHLKTGIGRLSAYCGAVSAGCGAAAGVCYLLGGGVEEISSTLANALAIDSGIVCDGAKSSCAAKIATAVEAGLLGMEMSRLGSAFSGGDGILADGVEGTINNVGELARLGMKETDEEIIRLMIKK